MAVFGDTFIDTLRRACKTCEAAPLSRIAQASIRVMLGQCLSIPRDSGDARPNRVLRLATPSSTQSDSEVDALVIAAGVGRGVDTDLRQLLHFWSRSTSRHWHDAFPPARCFRSRSSQ
jgi:hypothetical protein